MGSPGFYPRGHLLLQRCGLHTVPGCRLLLLLLQGRSLHTIPECRLLLLL